jgi:hypothetical protein
METRAEHFIDIVEGFKLGSLGVSNKPKVETPKQRETREAAEAKDEADKKVKELKTVVDKIFKLRSDRITHPHGKFDNAKRWYPSDEEKCDCCEYIRGPTRAFPFSYMTHCRTKKHVAALVNKLGIDDPSIQKELKAG